MPDHLMIDPTGQAGLVSYNLMVSCMFCNVQYSGRQVSAQLVQLGGGITVFVFDFKIYTFQLDLIFDPVQQLVL